MKQFRSLTCTNDKQLSLCLLPAYLDTRPPPEEIGSLTLVELVAHKAVLLDDAYPGYYFAESAKTNIGIKGLLLNSGIYGLLIKSR